MRAKRTDNNHREIVGALRQVGAQVLDLHAIPGALDLLIGFRSTLFLVEVKNGKNWKLTPAEENTIDRFRSVGCPVHVVETAADLLRAIGAIE